MVCGERGGGGDKWRSRYDNDSSTNNGRAYLSGVTGHGICNAITPDYVMHTYTKNGIMVCDVRRLF